MEINNVEQKILNALYFQRMNITGISREIKISRYTISKYLMRLEAEKKVVCTESGRSKIFRAVNNGISDRRAL